jgi:solute carrier family 35 (UDP-xylose/UDP-N-acetylglucosamine transporter), member B4
MGAYVEDVFSQYKASWTENLFYGHLLSLPLFLPITSTLRLQYDRLVDTPILNVDQLIKSHNQSPSSPFTSPRLLETFRPFIERLPSGILFLTVNTLTQLACISGVNLLSSKTSAVTVTIVLNIRKLVSFIFSTLLFGHALSGKMVLGATMVFGSGALYGYETSWRLPQQRKKNMNAEAAKRGSNVNGSIVSKRD